jgi:hypothetical protein
MMGQRGRNVKRILTKYFFTVQHLGLSNVIGKMLRNEASLVDVQTEADSLCDLQKVRNHKKKVLGGWCVDGVWMCG